jgi:hypothetical protein
MPRIRRASRGSAPAARITPSQNARSSLMDSPWYSHLRRREQGDRLKACAGRGSPSLREIARQAVTCEPSEGREIRSGTGSLGDPHVILLSMSSKRELVEAAEGIRRIIDSVERGELDAPPGLLARLDGAARALEVLAAQVDEEDPR